MIQKKDINPKVLTHAQEEWVCDQIGHWYKAWKHCIRVEGYPEQHRLGFAMNDLKSRLCQVGDWAKSDQEFLEIVDAMLKAREENGE